MDTTDQGIYYSELKVSPDGYVWSKLGLAADTSVKSFIIAREDPAVPVIIIGAGPIASGEPWVSGTALNDALESLGGSGNITIDTSGDFFTLGAVVDADAAGSYYYRSDFAKHPSHASSSVITDHTTYLSPKGQV